MCDQVIENNDCIADSGSTVSSYETNVSQDAKDNEFYNVDPLKHIINKIVEYRENKIFLMHKNPDLNEQQYLYDTYGISVPQGARCIGGCCSRYVYQLRCCDNCAKTDHAYPRSFYFCQVCARKLCAWYKHVCPFCGCERHFDDNVIVVEEDVRPEMSSSPTDEICKSPRHDVLGGVLLRSDAYRNATRRCLNGCLESMLFRLACCKATKQSLDVYYCQECINKLLKKFDGKCPWCGGLLEQEITPVDISDEPILPGQMPSDQ
jgi:hypothetical protein